MSHFFHRAIKAYNTGNRKRRKIQGDDFGDVRWHKTGRTKPVIMDGVQRGCKKIMVLYVSTVRGGKAEKTNWVMHQYHLGTGEDERDGEYVISKIFYQQQQANKGEKPEEDLSENIDAMIAKVDPVTPKSVTPEPPYTETERHCPAFYMGQECINICTDPCAQVRHFPLLFYSLSSGLQTCFLGSFSSSSPFFFYPMNKCRFEQFKFGFIRFGICFSLRINPHLNNPNFCNRDMTVL